MIRPYVFIEISVCVQYFGNLSLSCIHVYFVVTLLIAFYFFSSRRQKVNTITKKNEHALRHPYQTHAKTKIMSEIEEVQEQMKGDMEAMKDQMTSMMEAMMSMRRMMEDNTAAVATTSAATEADLTHPSGINQTSRPIPDVVG